MSTNYYKTPEYVKEYIHLAKDVSGTALIEKLKAYLPSLSSVLEIGSGPGTDWNILRRDFNVIGSDNSNVFLDHLYSNYPNGRFLELDAITLNTKDKFHGIYTNKVLHHLKDDELIASIKRQHEVLHPKGIICHSFWKGEGSEIFKGLYVNYHTQESLTTFFKTHFEILSISGYKEFKTDDSLLLIGKKK